MTMSVMNFNRIRELVSNLGWIGDDHIYRPGPECLGTLEMLEDELMNENPMKRTIRISLHICGTVKKDLIPIICYAKDQAVVVCATKILVNLSLPIEYLIIPNGTVTGPRYENMKKQLAISSLAIKKAFLDVSATLSLVTVLRETMIKSEKHMIPLKEEDCNYLKNCLLLIRNLLHIPERNVILDPKFCEWRSVQSKLIWNLFVQGIDGALLLMFNSRYRAHWTVPLALIMALLYKNQNVGKVHRAIELISSASETSEDEQESDGSKNSSTSLSSEQSKNRDTCLDSGCPPEAIFPLKTKRNRRQLKGENTKKEPLVSDIHTKLEKVQIKDDCTSKTTQTKSQKDSENKQNIIYADGNASESSSGSETPQHKRMKGYSSPGYANVDDMANNSKTDSAVSMRGSSPEMMNTKSSDDDIFEQTQPLKNLKAVQKLRCMQMNSKMSESDSSNEEIHSNKLKYRNHPPTGRRGKSPRRNTGCSPSICMSSAFEASSSKGRIRYPLWEKRNSVSTLVAITSPTPSDEDIGNLMKEFTLSFLHSGFSHLILDLKNLLLEGPSLTIDKSLFFWILSYFLNLATNSHICVDHISDILSVDIVSYLVYECTDACENMEFHTQQNTKIAQYVAVNLNLLVIALKEIMCTIDMCSRRCTSPKDKALFNELSGKLAGLQDLRNMPLLLFRNCSQVDALRFLEDVIVLNHQILVIIGRGSDHCLEPNKVNFSAHLKMFCTGEIVSYYGKVLEYFKCNSHFLNDCVFTMMHHMAGDMRSYELLFKPSILKVFSEMLKNEMELEQYQEDLIMYILNKFSVQVYQKALKEENIEKSAPCSSGVNSSSDSCTSSNCALSEDDDLFWWYLQFEQDNDPISKISEHVPTSKRDILAKLQLKGHISDDKYRKLEEIMEAVHDNNSEVSSENSSNSDDDITRLLRILVQAGERQHIIWLQEKFLEVCYIKLGLNTYLPESVPFYCMKMNVSVPLVPYTEEQRAMFRDPTFLQLLQNLGLYLDSGVCQMYPRIPVSWTADMLFNIATRLGPVKKDKLKFFYDDLMLSNSCRDAVPVKNINGPPLPPLSSCITFRFHL
ncbi:protein timeless-like isoform X2 [Argiope bruennichi]|uniref:protein timeless-like isoform X2 n=1 Tax=Argiope bruennichi TaxID=94029 RepID=UPI0024950FAC|nr:protein timeless-like isoform X2 [Argiope bruennichi]